MTPHYIHLARRPCGANGPVVTRREWPSVQPTHQCPECTEIKVREDAKCCWTQ